MVGILFMVLKVIGQKLEAGVDKVSVTLASQGSDHHIEL